MKDKFSVLGIKLDRVNRYQALNKVEELFKKKTASLICTVNVEFIINAQDNPDFYKVLNEKSAMNLMDGSGVIWATSFLSGWTPKTKGFKETYVILMWLLYLIFYPFLAVSIARRIPKISGSDFVWEVCKWAADNNKSIFILGNKLGLDPNSAQKASLQLQTNIYGLNVAGTHSSTPNPDDEKNDVEMIKKSGADIVFCAFGSPAQELWLAKNLNRTGAKIGIGLGGTFDFIAGVQKRAPRFVSAIGFEWLWRLFSHPRRIKRQLALPRFALAILRERLKGLSR